MWSVATLRKQEDRAGRERLDQEVGIALRRLGVEKDIVDSSEARKCC